MERQTARSAMLAVAHLQTVGHGNKTLMDMALPRCQQESQPTLLAIKPHVQLGGEAAATRA